jgi:hypothetical protein
MSWKRIGAIVALVLIGAAFLVGFLPERRLRLAAEQQSRTAEERLAEAETRIRIGQLLGDALMLKEVTSRQNYGQAQTLSSGFFDRVRETAADTRANAYRDALTDLLAKRDTVTASLAKGDPTVIEILRTIEVRLRRALGYPLPPETQAN